MIVVEQFLLNFFKIEHFAFLLLLLVWVNSRSEVKSLSSHHEILSLRLFFISGVSIA